jgi:putative phage-type endonuclease|tara:strand:+ start:983 stop:1600 length:618 start_codon:yes stop_codon:yes gene_type:complete
MEQRSDEWFAARTGKITASTFKDMMTVVKTGESQYKIKLRQKLAIERLTGKRIDDTFVNKAMQDGIDREPIAKELFEKRYGFVVNNVGFINNKDVPMSGASPDGLIGDDAVVEIKCPTHITHFNNLMATKLPKQYNYQVQWQMACAECSRAHFISYHPDYPDNLNIKYILVERDDELIENMKTAAHQFNIEIEDLILKLKESNNG